jgi:predicted amidophosphoribosyltransferase
VNSPFPKIKLFEWNENVAGSLRNQPNYEARRSFISNNLHTVEGIELQDKNIIVLDDQFTSSATANEICTQLRNKGVKKILFIALFYLILPVVSKACPQCGKPLKIKIRRNDGNRFYSCLPAKFGGQGCGYTENIA